MLRTLRTAALLLPLAYPLPDAVAQKARDLFRNVELCNSAPSADIRIEACSAFIAAGRGGRRALAVAHNNRGAAFAARADFDRAFADFAEAVGIDPTFAKPVNNRGAARLRRGEYDAAIADFDGAIALDPGYAAAYANRAEALLKKGDRARAEADYLAAVRLNDDLEGAWSGLCWLGASSPDARRLPEAVKACDQAVARGSHTAATYDSRALAHLKAGRLDAALADYESALRIDPRMAPALYGRGLTKIRRGDRTGGEADLAAARGARATVAEEFAGYGVR